MPTTNGCRCRNRTDRAGFMRPCRAPCPSAIFISFSQLSINSISKIYNFFKFWYTIFYRKFLLVSLTRFELVIPRLKVVCLTNWAKERFLFFSQLSINIILNFYKSFKFLLVAAAPRQSAAQTGDNWHRSGTRTHIFGVGDRYFTS